NVFVTSMNVSDIDSTGTNNSLWGAYSSGNGAPNAPSSWTGGVMATGTDGGDGLPRGWSDPKATFDQFGNLFLAYMSGTVAWSGQSSGNNGTEVDRTLTDTNAKQKWVANEWVGTTVSVNVTKDNTAYVENRKIVSNTANSFQVDEPWDKGLVPDQNSTFLIRSPGNSMIVVA